LQVQAVAAGTQAASRWSRRVFGGSALAVWTRQLAGLVGSGLPLERALASLSSEAETEAERNLVAQLRAEVNSGSTFARALAQHPQEFSGIYVAVIGAGEQSGKLGLVLEHLANDLEDQQALHAKLLGAALYPAIVSAVALCIVLFLVTYVVPQVASVFAGSKRALPLLTVLMLALSDFVRSYGLWLLLLVAAGAFAAQRALRVLSTAAHVDAIITVSSGVTPIPTTSASQARITDGAMRPLASEMLNVASVAGKEGHAREPLQREQGWPDRAHQVTGQGAGDEGHPRSAPSRGVRRQCSAYKRPSALPM
jgi:type II secretory pathway component PulF